MKMTEDCLSEMAYSESTWEPDLNDISSSLTDTPTAEEQKNAFEPFRIKCRNQRKIIDGLNNGIDDLQQQSDNLRTHNDALQKLVNTLDTRLQAFEGQDVLHNELRQIIDVLRPPQLPPQLPPEQVVITALRVEAASDHDPH